LEEGGIFKPSRLVYVHKNNAETINVRKKEKIFITQLDEKILILETENKAVGLSLSNILTNQPF
jgi:hypothetical protein